VALRIALDGQEASGIAPRAPRQVARGKLFDQIERVVASRVSARRYLSRSMV
jgi:hypothetical protein